MNKDGDSNEDNNLFNKASSWVEKHPGDYQLIVDECYSLLEVGKKKIYLKDVIGNLIWHKEINITRSYAEPLTLYMNENEPGLKGKFTLEIQQEEFSYKDFLEIMKIAKNLYI